jgi:hypothetical protein
VAAGGIQAHAAGTVEGEAVGAGDRHLQVQQGAGGGLETVVGSQGQGQAAVGTAENDRGGRVRQGQAGVQGQGARRAAAIAVGIQMQHLRQTVERAIKGDAPGRPAAAEAHLSEQSGAAVATGEIEFSACRLGRQCIVLPVGGAVPGGAQTVGTTVPDDGGGGTGRQAAEVESSAEAAGVDAHRRTGNKAG